MASGKSGQQEAGVHEDPLHYWMRCLYLAPQSALQSQFETPYMSNDILGTFFYLPVALGVIGGRIDRDRLAFPRLHDLGLHLDKGWLPVSLQADVKSPQRLQKPQDSLDDSIISHTFLLADVTEDHARLGILRDQGRDLPLIGVLISLAVVPIVHVVHADYG